MTTEQAIQDVAMIARNGIDRIIALERDKATMLPVSVPTCPCRVARDWRGFRANWQC